MLQIISGETLKMHYTNVGDSRKIKRSLISLCKSINSNIVNKNILYNQKKTVQLKSTAFNLINLTIDDKFKKILKDLLITEAYKLEQYYPGSGDTFIELFVNYYLNKNKIGNVEDYKRKILIDNIKAIRRFEKKDLYKKIKTFENNQSKHILDELIQILSMETKVFIEKTSQTNNFITKTDKINFQIEFDDRFLYNSTWNSKKFKFIIIDGFIQEVSEIHHLLVKASEDKEDYVIFCKGASEEVKNTILYNLKRGTINVMPVFLKINEENVNILNDVAACLGSEIVSALKGDTISASVRRELSFAEDIKISKSGFSIKCLDHKMLKRQRDYLKKKIDSLNKDDPNFVYLIKRSKNLDSNKIVVKLSSFLDDQVKKDIDIFLNYISSGKRGIVNLKKCITSDKRKIYTLDELVIIFRKLKSSIDIVDSLGFAICKEK